jgi:hypothetical protein
MTEMDKIHFFVEGLRPRTRQELHYKAPTSVHEAVQLATKFEIAQFGSEGTGARSIAKSYESRAPYAKTNTFFNSRNYGKQNSGATPMELDVMVKHQQKAKKCYRCGKEGHFAKFCSSGQSNNGKHIGERTFSRPVKSGHLDNLELLEDAFLNAIKAESDYLTILPGAVNGHETKFLLDTGASHNFIYNSVVKRLGLPVEVSDIGSVKVGNNAKIPTLGVIKNVKIRLGLSLLTTEDVFVLPGSREEIILGIGFIKRNLPWDSLVQSLGVPSQPFQHEEEQHESLQLIEGSEAEREILDQKNTLFLSVIKPVDPSVLIKTDLVGVDAEKMKKLVLEYLDIFPEDLSTFPPERAVSHEIVLEDEIPVAKSQYRLSPLELKTAQETVSKLLSSGMIQHSKSPYSAPVLFVRKGDGSLRMVLDYRLLNKKTVKDKFPIPRISDLLDRLSAATIFSKLDLVTGFYQIRMSEKDIQKTAFSVGSGHYEFLVMPMGLSNAPATFQRCIRSIFGQDFDSFLLSYFDDLLIFSKSNEEHLEHLQQVLEQLRKHKLFAKLKKCVFGVQEVSFLGHTISKGMRSIDEQKIQTISLLSSPKGIREVRSMVGLANWVKDNVKSCAHILAPITDLLRNGKKFVWGIEQEKALEALKTEVLKNSKLKLPTECDHWVIQSDASDVALGATLLQCLESDSKPELVCFASRKLNDAEKKYPTHEKEMLAIYWACKHFRHYIEGNKIIVQTDHSALKFVMSQPTLSRRVTRWVEYLQNFDIAIQYISGITNSFADFLSRPVSKESKDKGTNSFQLIIGEEGPSVTGNEEQIDLNLVDWPIYMTRLLQNQPVDLPEKFHSFLQSEKKNFDYDPQLKVLYRKEGRIRKIFVPFHSRADVVASFHKGQGHLGISQVLEKLRTRYWWPYLVKDVKEWLKECRECQLFGNRQHQAFAEQTVMQSTDKILSRWHIDYAGPFPVSRRGNRYIFIAVEDTSRWPVARATSSMTAETTARVFYEEIISRYGVPDEIVSDRGSNFMSDVWNNLMEVLEVKHKRTSAFHPRSNGKVENLVGSIHRIIAKLCGSAVDSWDEFIEEALFSLRTRIHPSTGKSPFFLMYGCDPKLPGDSTKPFCLNNDDPKDRAEMRARLLESIGQTRQAAAVRSGITAQEAKLRYDRLVKRDPLKLGEWVLMRREFKIKTKLLPNWLGPYEIIEAYPSGVYKLKDPTGLVKNDLVHRDRLKRCHVSERPTALWTNTQLEKFDDQELALQVRSRGRVENNSLECIEHAEVISKNSDECQGVTSRGSSHGAPHG